MKKEVKQTLKPMPKFQGLLYLSKGWSGIGSGDMANGLFCYVAVSF